MKTYYTYFGDSQQAETKLKRAESQRVKSDQAGHTVIGWRFRRDYDKLSVKVRTFRQCVTLSSAETKVWDLINMQNALDRVSDW